MVDPYEFAESLPDEAKRLRAEMKSATPVLLSYICRLETHNQDLAGHYKRSADLVGRLRRSMKAIMIHETSEGPMADLATIKELARLSFSLPWHPREETPTDVPQ